MKNKIEDRIQINGEWYVKESTFTSKTSELHLDFIIGTQKYVIFENEYICLESYLDVKEVSTLEKQYLYVDFNNKRDKLSKTETWGNLSFLKGIVERNVESINELKSTLHKDDVEYVMRFMDKLSELGWITQKNC